jgi:hypothetical protein
VSQPESWRDVESYSPYVCLMRREVDLRRGVEKGKSCKKIVSHERGEKMGGWETQGEGEFACLHLGGFLLE